MSNINKEIFLWVMLTDPRKNKGSRREKGEEGVGKESMGIIVIVGKRVIRLSKTENSYFLLCRMHLSSRTSNCR
jgi:hypothetical protein